MQVQSIGLGPFYPQSWIENVVILLTLLFGLIWNIWFFYGLTGGWWADRSKTACDFEDQLGIIETYIMVAKQRDDAEKIRRSVGLPTADEFQCWILMAT